MATAVQIPIPHLSEASGPFFQLWPHRFDFLYAAHPEPDTAPNWYSERRYPLSDRAIAQGEQLYGVRFGKTTAYVMIDVDRGSAYHPARRPDKLWRIRQAMESIGLVECVVCSSSDSEGLHLYFPLDIEQKSWAIGIAVTALMERQGLKVKPGQLEVFPNARPHNRTGLPTLFNGHRLPMQNGSMVLNADLAPLIWSDQETFAQHWQRAKQRNQINEVAIQRLVKTRRRKFAVTTSAEKFLNDLDASIQEGWTDHGQTNFLLGRIAMRSYIFGHVKSGGPVLEGEALVKDIVDVAQHLPGYEAWCGHQHDITDRAAEWARCIESSEYYHYGKQEINTKNSEAAETDRDRWNTQQRLEARERITKAIKDLLEKGILASGITQRFNQLIGYRISGSTLYRHRDLWDPRVKETEKDQNLLDQNGCNKLPDKPYSNPQTVAEGCNRPARLDDWVTPSATGVNSAIDGPESSRSEPDRPIDVSDLLVAIQVARMRLDWSREDLRIYVAMNFGDRQRCQLSDGELAQLAVMLEALISQPPGVP